MDAHVILRYLTDAPADQAEHAARLFEAVAAGRAAILVEDVVLAEVVWTLASFYRRPKSEIASLLLTLLADDSVHNPDRETLQLALALFDANTLDFAGALLAARVLQTGNRDIYSFDRDFDRVPGITRREPA
ncbi:MAG: PIN domain-containing protein [Chloroflexi bacterium]|nr:PIN domain-containing protein [Chloroflexota bacterium]